MNISISRLIPSLHVLICFNILQYEDPTRQEAARKSVPVEELEEKALVSLAKVGEFILVYCTNIEFRRGYQSALSKSNYFTVTLCTTILEIHLPWNCLFLHFDKKCV